MRARKLFAVLILLWSVHITAQDPHAVTDSQIAAENLYNGISNRDDAAMSAEIHPEMGWKMTVEKVVAHLFSEPLIQTNFRLHEVEYEPLDNGVIRVKGLYSTAGNKIQFEHLWWCKDRKLVGFRRMEPTDALTESDKH